MSRAAQVPYRGQAAWPSLLDPRWRPHRRARCHALAPASFRAGGRAGQRCPLGVAAKLGDPLAGGHDAHLAHDHLSPLWLAVGSASTLGLAGVWGVTRKWTCGWTLLAPPGGTRTDDREAVAGLPQPQRGGAGGGLGAVAAPAGGRALLAALPGPPCSPEGSYWVIVQPGRPGAGCGEVPRQPGRLPTTTGGPATSPGLLARTGWSGCSPARPAARSPVPVPRSPASATTAAGPEACGVAVAVVTLSTRCAGRCPRSGQPARSE